MDDKSSPALVPALGLLLGTLLAPRLIWLPPAAVVLVLALAAALRHPAARLIAALALGLLSASVRGDASPGLADGIDASRPLEVVGRVNAHPVRQGDQVSFRVRTEVLRQRRTVAVQALDLWVSMPPDTPQSTTQAPAFGSKVRLKGYLRRSAELANGRQRRQSRPWRMRLKSARFLTLEEEPSAGLAAAARLRRQIEELLGACGPERRSPALVRALLLGDRSQLPKAWRQALRRCGLAHLLAVSGLHVGLLTLMLVSLTVGLPPRLRLAAGVAGIILYLALIGPRPTTLRAAAMGLLAGLALICERPPQALNALACAAALLVLWEPAMATDLGFQLSVAATAGILLLAPALGRWLPRGPAGRALAISLAAQVATLPLIVELTGGVHPLAPWLNLAAIPWLAVFLTAAVLWLVVAALSATAGAVLLPVLELLAWPLEALARLPPSAAGFTRLDLDPRLLWLLPMLSLWALRKPQLLRPAAVAFALVVSAAHAPPQGPHRTPSSDRTAAGNGPVELTVIDVGQGEAILLRDGRRAVLVDGGGWPRGDLGGRVLVPVLAAAGLERLDALVLTHPDTDHCAGLVDIARYLPADELWMAPGWSGRTCAGELLAAPGTRWRVLWRGRGAKVGRWRFEALHPPPGMRSRARHDNDRSLVLMAEVFGRRVLLTGDIESGVEKRLARRLGRDHAADVLKVAHHGSKTSTTSELLEAVQPRLALISAGAANVYGHPHPSVLQRLESLGVRTLRTDRSGMVRLRFHPSGKVVIDFPGSGTAAARARQQR